MKKFVSFVLSLVIVLLLVPSAFAVETVSADNKFTDVPANAWYLDDLNYAIAIWAGIRSPPVRGLVGT